jgi:hypothetical protein
VSGFPAIRLYFCNFPPPEELDMPRSPVVVCVVVAVVTSAACAKGQFGPSVSTPVVAAPRPIDKLSVEERRAIMERAQVWTPIQTSRLNLLTGPGGDGAFPFDAEVNCTYDYPDKPLSGVTPKFNCDLGKGDVVKVKYGESNGEVYAEVAASRLFWALGFIADRMYPVRVNCANCPPEPHKESGPEWRLGKSGSTATRVFDPAAIERDFPGEKVEVPGFEGWAWPELERLDGRNGAPRAHLDALKLLAVFVQHVDNKPEQQAIICAEDSIGRDRAGNATCGNPFLMVKDLGSTFGGGKAFNYDKMKLGSWKSVPIWKDKDACQGNLIRSIIGNLEHPMISEEGRRFLAERLQLLSDAQIRDLFRASRVDKRGDNLDEWVAAFKNKRDQIVNHRCRA